MTISNWLKREKVGEMTILPGDSIELSYTTSTGKEIELLKTEYNKSFTFNEVGIFEGKLGNKDVLGGVFISK